MNASQDLSEPVQSASALSRINKVKPDFKYSPPYMSYMDDGLTESNICQNPNTENIMKSSHPYSVGFGQLRGTIRSTSYDESLISHLKEKEITKQKLRSTIMKDNLRNIKDKCCEKRHDKILHKNQINLSQIQNDRSRLKR